jgi:hypothetical protein
MVIVRLLSYVATACGGRYHVIGVGGVAGTEYRYSLRFQPNVMGESLKGLPGADAARESKPKPAEPVVRYARKSGPRASPDPIASTSHRRPPPQKA